MALPEIVSTTELTEVWGVTPQHVHRLAKEGVIPAGSNGKYACKPTLLAFAQYQREAALKARGDGSASKIKDARTREIELRIAQREGQLIDIDEANAAMDELAGIVRSTLSGFPSRFTRDMELRRKLEKAVNEILHAVADKLADKARAVRAGGNADTPVDSDDAGSVGTGKSKVSRKRGRTGKPKS